MTKSSFTGTLRKLLVIALLVANIAVLMPLWACCAITWLDPSSFPRIAVACLTFPIFLILNLLFIPVWIVLRVRLLLVPVAGMLLCTDFILDYCPMHRQTLEPDTASITVMSWNAMSLSYKDLGERQDGLLAYFDSVNADIICLQECGRGKLADTLKQHMTDAGYLWTERRGRTLYSRFPIVAEDTISAETSLANGINVYTLLLPEGDTLIVMNSHLESNFLSTEDKYDGKAALLSGSEEDMKREGNNILDKLVKSQRYRGTQTNALTAALDEQFRNSSAIVCGDFNDTPISYTYQQVAHRLKNAYRNRGLGVGVSYNEQYFLFRIDHIFHTADWETVAARVDNDFLASDHYPVIVSLHR